MARNSLLLLLTLACLMVTGSMAVMPSRAHADGSVPELSIPSIPEGTGSPTGYIQPVDIYECANYGGMQLAGPEHQPPFVPDDGNYTLLVKTCIKGTIQTSVIDMLGFISTYIQGTVAVMVTLAVAFFGIRVLGGEEELTGKMVSMLFRIGIVLLFSSNLGGYGNTVFSIMDELNAIVVPDNWGGQLQNGQDNEIVWVTMDQFINKLVGFSENSTGVDQTELDGSVPGNSVPPEPKADIRNGMIGIVGAALFSGGAGPYLFITGLIAMADILFFIFGVIMLYLDALMTIGFLLIISPLIIPLALFFYTERFVKKWMDILIAALLTQPLLLAFLWIFLNLFGQLIGNIFAVIWDPHSNLPPDFRAYWQLNMPRSNQMVNTDPNLQYNQQNASQKAENGKKEQVSPPIPSFMNSFTGLGATDTMMFPGENFGPNTTVIVTQLIYAFVTLWIYASLMKSMIEKIPEIANSIAQATSGLSWGSAPLEAETKGKLKEAQAKMGGDKKQ